MDFVLCLPDGGRQRGAWRGLGRKETFVQALGLVLSASGRLVGCSCPSELQSLLKLSSKSEY